METNKVNLTEGTRVKLTRQITSEETCCGDYDKDHPGVLVDEDGDMLFWPDGYPEGWGFYFASGDVTPIEENRAFNYVNILSPKCDGWINLFFDDLIVAMIRDKYLAERIKAEVPERINHVTD